MTNKLFAFPVLCVLMAALLLSSASPAQAQKYVFNEMSGLPNSASTGILSPGTLATNTAAMAQGDFNGDGRLDLAVIELVNVPPPAANAWVLQIYLGQPDGSFAPPTNYSMPGQINTGDFSPQGLALAVGDVNGDGIPDLVYTELFEPSFPNTMVVQLGKGDGTFQAPIVTLIPESYPASIALGDLNGDGKLDLVIADTLSTTLNAGAVDVHLGNGDGSFAAAVEYPQGSGTGGPNQILIADFNRDNKLDVISAGPNAPAEVFLGNGDGTLKAPLATGAGAGATGSSVAIAVADMNGDGILDLVVPDNPLQVLLGNGDGTFQTPITTSVAGKDFETISGV